MKFKYLFSASAMIALMASCSNEVETLTNDSTATRPSAGQVELVASMGDADSRATWTGAGWKFNEASDRFGVMLMDTWNQTNEGNTTIADYTFVDYIHTNYPFHSEDGGYTWQSPENAPLSEGNYFFTYPFDPTYQHRGRVYFEVPNVQSNVTEEGNVNAAWPVKYYQKYLGYAFIPAQSGVNKVDVSFHSLFANPKFKIMNATGMNIRMIKMLVRTHQEGKAEQPELMPTKLQLAPSEAKFYDWNERYAAGELTGAEETAALFSHATTVENGFFGEDKLDGVYEYVLDCGDNYVVPAGEFFRLSAVMPAGEYWNFDIYAFVEIQNSEKTTGIIRLADLEKSNWSNMDTQNGSMQTVLKPGITQVLTASFDANSVANLGLKDFTVVTSEDLEFVVDLKAKDGGVELVIIKTLGENVVLTEEVYDLISDVNRKGIKWQIDGTIVIPADAAADAIDQLTTGEGGVKTTIINKGTQVLTKNLVDCDVINEGTITGDVTIYGDVKNTETGTIAVTKIEGTVNNKGSVEIDTVIGQLNNGAYGWSDRNNYVKEAVASVNNAYGYVWNQGGTVNLRNLDEKESGTEANVTNRYGVLNLNGGKVYRVTLFYGEANVNGNTEAIQWYNINGSVTNINTELVVRTLKNNNVVNISETGELKGDLVGGEKDAVRNEVGGTINVEGKLAERVKNAGLINVIGDGIVIVENGIENVYGVIDVTAANESNTAFAAKSNDEGNQMYFAYTVKEEKNANELVETLKNKISSKNYGKNPVILTWGENSATSFEGGLRTPNATKVVINNNLTIAKNAVFEDTESFVVNGFLTVANFAELNVKDDTEVVIDGTLKANDQSTLAGKVSVDGAGAVIIATENSTWKKGDTFSGNWKE